MNSPVNTYIIAPKVRPQDNCEHIYWANTLGEAIARRSELEAEFGADFVIAARLFE